MLQETLHLLPINSNTSFALWEITSQRDLEQPSIFLTHGTFSTKKVLNGIVEYFTQKGYTCWVMEWRNHGSSPKVSNEPFDFEDLAKDEIRLTLEYLIHQKGIRQLDCITHSGGGIILTIALLHFPDYQQYISKVTFFACQAFGASINFSNRIKIQLGKYLTGLIGRIPARLMASEESESYYMMKQWFDWNITTKFENRTGRDYKKEMEKICIPIFSISGKGDTFIAPPSGCASYLKAFDNPQNKFLLASQSAGFQEDYTHSRIIHSRTASQDIYPLVLEWFQDY
jgi:predicted alpha/beta hydrolase